MTVSFKANEKYLSQIPALQVLVALGYQYLSPASALANRDGRLGEVLLEGVLRDQLARLNRIRYQDREYVYSEANVQEAVQRLKGVSGSEANEATYDLLTLGVTLEQVVEGNRKSFTLRYVDWKNRRIMCFM